MIYFIDTEFNSHGGELLSLALVRMDGEALYMVRSDMPELHPWVEENVKPILYLGPAEIVPLRGFGRLIQAFLKDDPKPHIVSDWPEDLRYFCETLITEPGQMVAIPGFTMEVVRVDAWPTSDTLVKSGAVQHNAYWDACALRELFVD